MKNKFDAIKEIKYDFVEYFNKNEIETDEFFKALSLCHGTKTRLKKTENSDNHDLIYDYLRFEDEISLNFARKCGYSFEASVHINQTTAYKISHCGKMEYYPILGINYETCKRKNFSIVLKREALKSSFFDNEETDNSLSSPNLQSNDIENGGMLYIKGSFESLKDNLLLSECEKETLKEMIDSLEELGCYTKIYGKKELTIKQTRDYIKLMLIHKSSLTMGDEEGEKCIAAFEKNITFLSLVCLEMKKEEGVDEMVSSLKAAKIKTSFLSSNDLSNTLVAAYQSGILSREEEVFHLSGDSYESTYLCIKTMLHKLKKKIQISLENEKLSSSNIISKSELSFNYYLLLNFKSFSIILKDKFLCSHLIFLLNLSNGVIGYEFNKKGKKKLLKIIKEKSFEETNILTIGFSFGDIGMYEKSEIAVQTNKENSICPDSGHITVKNRKIFTDLFFRESFICKERFIFIISNMIYYSFLLAWPTVFSRLFNDYSNTVFIRQELITSKVFFFVGLTNILAFSFADEKKLELEKNKTVPLDYYYQRRIEKKQLTNIFVDKFIFSFIDSLYFFIVWRSYQSIYYHKILVISNFLPKMLQFSSFIIFYMTVRKTYLKNYINQIFLFRFYRKQILSKLNFCSIFASHFFV